MLLSLLQLNPFTKNTVIATLVTVNVIAIAYILVSRDSVKKAMLIYDHPAVIQKTEFKRVQGPVRIVERIVTQPGGERVVERTITRDPVVITRDVVRESKPVQVTGSTLRGRYLLGASWETTFTKNGTGWVGYSVLDRLDLMGGVGWKDADGFSGHLMAVTRWGS